MADVEFGKLGDGCDRHDIVESQAMAGMRLDAILGGERACFGDATEFGGLLFTFELAIMAGMEFNDWSTEPECGINLLLRRFDEQRDADPGFA